MTSMHWRKLGRIFDPSEHALANDPGLFAQSPQALVFDDFVRVYFSTRSLEPTGKFLSHIAFADFSPDFARLIRVSNHEVIPLGNLGCFDEHGIFPMNVRRAGDRIHGYTCGWSRRKAVSVETAIGYVISDDDGQTFRRLADGPILGPTPNEPFLVGDAFVIEHEGVLHMWYIFGREWKRFDADGVPERIYKIAHATSSDGFEWHKEDGRQIVADRLGPDESQALPTVINVGGRYHMFFCYRESFDFRRNAARSYRIGHAWSDDLLSWTRADDDPELKGTPGDWDGEMQCYPNVFHCRGKTYLLYNGNEFGRHGFGLAVLEQ